MRRKSKLSAPESEKLPLRMSLCRQCVKGFDGMDEEVWEDGFIFCPAAGGMYEIMNGVPKNCHMCLEYLMLSSTKKG